MKTQAKTAIPATLAAVIARARNRGGVDVPANLSLNQLARRAGISPSQLSRIENGKLRKPNRAILIALARALNRNPVPLLVLVGHLSGRAAQLQLRDFFRPGAEAPEEWADWAQMSLAEVRTALLSETPNEEALRSIAADLFAIEETVETMWHDAFSLMVSTGSRAQQLQQFASIFRELDDGDCAQVLAHATALRDRNDLEYRLERAEDRIRELQEGQS